MARLHEMPRPKKVASMLASTMSLAATGWAVPSLALAHQHAAIGPARARAAIRCALIDAPPPDGFEWSTIVLEQEVGPHLNNVCVFQS